MKPQQPKPNMMDGIRSRNNPNNAMNRDLECFAEDEEVKVPHFLNRPLEE